MPPAYNPVVWSAFLSTEASAAAALTGLVFVAVSINLSQIVISKPLVARAAKAIFTLVGILAAATFALIPGQSAAVLGAEIAASGVIVWLVVTRTQHVSHHRNPYVSARARFFFTVLTQIASLQFIAAGVSCWLGRGGGLYWLVGATLGSFVVACWTDGCFSSKSSGETPANWIPVRSLHPSEGGNIQ